MPVEKKFEIWEDLQNRQVERKDTLNAKLGRNIKAEQRYMQAHLIPLEESVRKG